MSALPDPLTPPDCDLRGLPFMPMDVVRILDSDLFALSTGDEFKAALALWCKAWLQVPAASLPDDDRVLAHLSGAGGKWKKIRDAALRNWIKCSDGRFYHPTVAEKAIDAWERRGDWQEKQNNKTERQQRWRDHVKAVSAELRSLGVTPPSNASLKELERLLVDAQASTRPSTVDAAEAAKTGTGTGTKEESSNDDSPSDDEPSLRPEEVFEFYQKLAAQLGRPVPRDFTPERRQLTKGRVAQYPLQDFKTVIAKCRGSPFLRGDKGRTPLTFDWLMKKQNFQKVLEGNYDG